MAQYRSASIASRTIARCHGSGRQGVPDVEQVAIPDSIEEARTDCGKLFGVPSERRYADSIEILDAAW